MSHFDEVVTSRAPLCAEGDLWFFGKDHLSYRELCMPLANGDDQVDKIMIFVELRGLQNAGKSEWPADRRAPPLYRRQ